MEHGPAMRHKTSIEIFTYWDHIRGPYDAPLRSQVEPAAVRHVLSDLFILEATPSDRPRFRLAGTKICNIFGRELREEDFSALWAGSQPDDPVKIANGVMAHAVPALINATGYSVTGRHLAFEIVLMPLRSSREGENCDRLLGSLAPAQNPAWFGAEPLEFLALDRSRILTDDQVKAGEPTRQTAPFGGQRTSKGPEWSEAFRRILPWRASAGGRIQ
ncbi:PAS domain-containing protein [Rhizobium sp. BK376]|uniref:PAS domain-containing protein n=1 Tax=Rhizobium sp. BK376 TaxID=2512149 RepID=UPI001FE02F83|nr:PAS domain-containing protein [Rhizobium sp. BK376]